MSEVGDRVRVTVPPWVGALGTIENINGAYHVIRLDTFRLAVGVHELYPCEFEAADEGETSRSE